ncbi:unnamed protein product [Haemonchus placei]|uniref:C-type lectin domain-containing protein n=1 Tax=Haemonchus placei TaxID=6290 RepID=A0A0N4WKR3_HAEPC|nr:unnamed protein product [Haemonchus placei]
MLPYVIALLQIPFSILAINNTTEEDDGRVHCPRPESATSSCDARKELIISIVYHLNGLLTSGLWVHLSWSRRYISFDKCRLEAKGSHLFVKANGSECVIHPVKSHYPLQATQWCRVFWQLQGNIWATFLPICEY